MSESIEIPAIVSVPREQYLIRVDAKLRSDAARLAKRDPAIYRHLTLVEFAEDLRDRHEIAAKTHREHPHRDQRKHLAADHDRYASKARQLMLHHLDQLAHLIL